VQLLCENSAVETEYSRCDRHIELSRVNVYIEARIEIAHLVSELVATAGN
jgi:hypothetical protein